MDPGMSFGHFNLLTFAAFYGNNFVVKKMDESNVSWKSDLDGMNALHLATLNDHEEVVEYLTKNKKCKINETCKEELTALHIACRENSNNCIKYLLNVKGIDIDAQSKGNFTPLHFAVFNNNALAIKLLREKGASKSICDEKGRKPFDLIESKSEENLLEFIVDILRQDYSYMLEVVFEKRPEAINFKTKETENNILHLCVLNNAKKCLRLCMKNNQNMKKEKNKNGETPLFMEGMKIIDKGKEPTKIFDKLADTAKDYDEYIDEPDNKGYNILLKAIERGKTEFAEKLINVYNSKIKKLIDNEEIQTLNINLNLIKDALTLKDQRGETLFYTAVRMQNMQIIKHLLEYNSIISLDGPSETAICFLASKKEIRYIEILRLIAVKYRNEAKFNAKNQNQETPLQISLRCNNLEAFKVIAARGRKPVYLIPDLCKRDSNIEFIKYLDSRFKFFNDIDQATEKTMLEIARKNKCNEIVNFLLKRKNASSH